MKIRFIYLKEKLLCFMDLQIWFNIIQSVQVVWGLRGEVKEISARLAGVESRASEYTPPSTSSTWTPRYYIRADFRCFCPLNQTRRCCEWLGFLALFMHCLIHFHGRFQHYDFSTILT